MELNRLYVSDDVSIRDQDGQKLVYQRNRDHMYLIPEFGATILNTFSEECSMRAALEACGIRWEELDAAGQLKLTEFIDGLLERQLLLQVPESGSEVGREVVNHEHGDGQPNQ